MSDWKQRALTAAMLVVAGCGYRPMVGSSMTATLSVVGAPTTIADVVVISDVESGLRVGLARAGALRNGASTYPRVVVEVLRVDRVSEGVVALPGGRRATSLGGLPLAPRAPLAPLARATRVAVVARAWVERESGAARERGTGDVRASDIMTAEQAAALETLRDDDALRASARRLGERLARIVLGYPDSSDDAM